MPTFIGISPGEEKTGPGIRVRIRLDGSAAWMHGKWLDLGPDHAVIWIEGRVEFVRPDGKILWLGQFPAWPVGGRGKRPATAAMFNIGQFRGGKIRITSWDRTVTTYAVPICS